MDQDFFNLFLELHKNLPRQAPGSRESTLRALTSLHLTGDNAALPLIIDMGCGPGAHTLDLLQALPGRIVALDLLPEFLDELASRANKAGLKHRLLSLVADMARPPLPDKSCDLIWSEAAIYNIGFDQGLALWARLLKAGGFLVCSELCWTNSDPSRTSREFWEQEYPAMRSVEENLRALQSAGFLLLDWFVLPESDWWQEYYAPLEKRLEAFEVRHAGNDKARAVVDMERQEIGLRRKAGRDYGYVFFVTRKEDNVCGTGCS